MKLRHITFIFFAISLLFSSCTIEKRLHKKGYYVEWRNFKSSQTTKVESKDLINHSKEMTNELVELNEDPILEVDQNLLSTNDQTPNEILPPKTSPKSKSINNPILNTSIHHKIRVTNSARPRTFLLKKLQEDKPKPQYNRMASIGLALALLSLLLFPLVIPALITSSIALRQIKNSQKKYKNKYMALIGYLFSIFIMTLAFLLIAIFLLLFEASIIWASIIFLTIIVITLCVINV